MAKKHVRISSNCSFLHHFACAHARTHTHKFADAQVDIIHLLTPASWLCTQRSVQHQQSQKHSIVSVSVAYTEADKHVLTVERQLPSDTGQTEGKTHRSVLAPSRSGDLCENDLWGSLTYKGLNVPSKMDACYYKSIFLVRPNVC